jgi:hypothetical protein
MQKHFSVKIYKNTFGLIAAKISNFAKEKKKQYPLGNYVFLISTNTNKTFK